MTETTALEGAATLKESREHQLPVDEAKRRQWRNWLHTLLLVAVAGGALLYLAVVLIDPFSTGRFSLTQRIDITTSNTRLAKAGLVRDPRFDAAIFGDSTAFPLDPTKIAGTSGWRLAQLAIPAATPANILTVARSFERHHPASSTLEVFVLGNSWCRSNGPNENPYGPFPDWLYESTNGVYLSRILFSDAVVSAVARVGIWLGLANQAARADGYSPKFTDRNLSELLSRRPTVAPPPDAPFPAIDALAAHISALPDNYAVAFVFAPPYVSALPPAGSVAAARLQACKQRVRQLASGRASTAYLDLMTVNSITQAIENYEDTMHYNAGGARLIEPIIARLIEETGFRPN